jgi:hypothetical protein
MEDNVAMDLDDRNVVDVPLFDKHDRLLLATCAEPSGDSLRSARRLGPFHRIELIGN